MRSAGECPQRRESFARLQSSASMLTRWIRAPLKAEDIAIGVDYVELLHAIGRDFRFFYVHTHCSNPGVGILHVWTSEKESDFPISHSPLGIRYRRTVRRLVGRVQHKL